MPEPRQIAALTLAAAAFSTMAFAGVPSLPDSALTPGAVATTSAAAVCSYGYSRAHRVWHDKADTLKKYGIPLSRARDFEDDDRIPVCLGGDNADPRNHWPEPWAEARVKDRLEAATCRAVCAGRITLQHAQVIFLGDWRPYLGTEP